MITFVYVLAGWIFSVCLHEWAHARVAYEGGDTGVKDRGYLSFNPLRYTDPLLSIALPTLFLIMGGIGLPGGAVFIDERRLGQPRRPQGGKAANLVYSIERRMSNAAWRTAVALAGPLANLALAILIGLALRFFPPPREAGGPALAFIGMLQVTAVLFNLLPIPPLDGYRIIRPHLDPHTRQTLDSFAYLGMFLLFFVVFRVPAINDSFWDMVRTMCDLLGIRRDWAWEGYKQFMFWRN